jgi:hypothetical protein
MRIEIPEGAMIWGQDKRKKVLRSGQTLKLQGRTATRTSTLTVQGDRALWLEIRGDSHLAEKNSKEWEEYRQRTKRNGRHGRPERVRKNWKTKRTRDNAEQGNRTTEGETAGAGNEEKHQDNKRRKQQHRGRGDDSLDAGRGGGRREAVARPDQRQGIRDGRSGV